MKRRTEKRKVAILTAARVQYTAVKPVVGELIKRNWQVTVLHLEAIWERVESFLLKKRRRTLKSFYVAPLKIHEKTRNIYLVEFISKLVYMATKALRLRKPDIIIVMSEGTIPPRVAVAFGKLAGIPTLLLMQLGMLGRDYECPNFHADKICVAGEFVRDLLVSCGINENRIVVTGRPAYDSMIQAKETFDKTEICNRLALDPAKKILVYCTENLPQRETRDIVLAICNSVRGISGLQFIIKVHPAELSLTVYQETAKKVGIKAFVTRDAEISEVLFICDAMITGFSTTALDAMILDKPVITVNLTGLKDPVPFAESGAAIGVYDERDLGRAIEDGLFNVSLKEKLSKNREKFVYEQAFLKDGKATQRTLDLMDCMINEEQVR